VKDAEPLKRVRVLRPFQVVYDTVAYSNGDTPVVPVALADQWIKNQWVTASLERLAGFPRAGRQWFAIRLGSHVNQIAMG
jgi:hypothetical protein